MGAITGALHIGARERSGQPQTSIPWNCRHWPDSPVMSDHSKIEWTDATWNPVTGCVKVSPGCKHCYAETFAERFRGVVMPGGKLHVFNGGFDPQLRPERLEQPFSWSTSRMVFVNSMSDLF